jgi:acetolactate synthase-1/2/3 large subunit
MKTRGGRLVVQALELTRSGIPVMVEVPIDYSRKTYFTRGVVATTFWRLSWPDRLRMAGRVLARKVSGWSTVDREQAVVDM